MSGKSLNIKNKKARFEYHLFDTYTAGIVLSGTEIKSIRQNKASIVEAYCIVQNGEVFIRNMFINPYENASFYKHSPRTDRKLLLNKKEIRKITRFLIDKGNTLIPLKLFINEKGWVKVDIACAKGKKTHDKREDLKEKDDKRALDRAMKK
ncbi:MAG: SsrA-binding protein SmpB [Flavobacteriia bacterium]|nr:SsrA-binding protein SmpB [Flavobacteriia bacterium]